MLHHSSTMRTLLLSVLATLTFCLSSGVTFAQDTPSQPPQIAVEAAREAEVPPVAEKAAIEVVFAIDCSDSMTHAIDAAKDVIAVILRNLAREYPSRVLRVGFIRYGDAERRYVIYDFTSDQEKIGRVLTETHTAKINTEFVGSFIKKAITRCSWSSDKEVERRIYVVGNESADDGPVDYRIAANAAAKLGVSVHSVYCPLPNEELVVDYARRGQRVRQTTAAGTISKDFLTNEGEKWIAVQNTWLFMSYLGGGECYKVDSRTNSFQKWSPYQVKHLVEVVLPREFQAAQEAEWNLYLHNLRQSTTTSRNGRR